MCATQLSLYAALETKEEQLETSIDFIIFKKGPFLYRLVVAPLVFKLCKLAIPKPQ